MKAALIILLLGVFAALASAGVVVNFKVLSVPSLEAPTAIESRGLTKYSTVKTLPTTNWAISNLSAGSTVNEPIGNGNSLYDLVGNGYTASVTILPGLTVHWRPIKLGDLTVDMAVRGSGNGGWVGVGFTAGTYAMIGSDAVIGWVSSSGNVTIAAYHLQAKEVSKVVPNPSLEISNLAGEEVAAITTIRFTRVLNSGVNPITNVNSAPIIGAWSSNDYLIEHDNMAQQLNTVNLVTGDAVVSGGMTSMRLAHGAMNWIAWGVIFPVAIMIARYGKGIGKEGTWFEIHRIMQTIGLVMTFIAFVLAFVMANGSHFTFVAHSVIGVILFSFALFQVVYGVFRPHKEKGQPLTKARKVFEIIHPWTGRIVTLISVIQVFLGFIAIRAHLIFFVVEIIYVIILIIIVIVLEVRLRCCSGKSGVM